MAEDDRWLVAGLGNPEDSYGGTRHNVGADAARLLADRHRAGMSSNTRVRCEMGQFRHGDARVAVAVPMGLMNRCGGPVQQAAHWFKVPTGQIVVIHDDLDLSVGALRLKRGGGHGGHNGLKDIDRALGSSDYLRVRIGIGRPHGRTSPRDHVLRRFQPAEREEIDVTLEEAADAVEMLITDGLEPAQNRHHGSTTS